MGIVGYTDRMSARPGERLRFMVSVDDDSPTFTAKIVRFGSTDDNPWGRGLVTHAVDAPCNGTYPAQHQRTHPGSFVHVPGSAGHLSGHAVLTLGASVWPTLAGTTQMIVGAWSAARQSGIALMLDATNHPILVLGDGLRQEAIRLGDPVRERTWCFLAVTWDAAGSACLTRADGAKGRLVLGEPARVPASCVADLAGAPDLTVGASWEGDFGGAPFGGACFNGRIDTPFVLGGGATAAELEALRRADPPSGRVHDLVGLWDFGREIGSDRVVDLGPSHRHGVTINLPTRAVTGWRWDATRHDWTSAPEHYGAIHFHDDDIADCRWSPGFELTVPEDWPSGVYAAHVRAGDTEDYVVFFVTPRPGRPKARIAFLAATATYLAYANYRLQDKYTGYELYLGSAWTFGPADLFLCDHPEFGSSTYHAHADGSPIYVSTCRRPILNMRPRSVLWAFNGDMMVVDWLEALGYDFDVVTDEDLDREGLDVIRDYAVVLTGGHPEYASHGMLDALEAYTASGGRLMYLGANGFHSRVAFHPSLHGALERRWVDSGPNRPGPGEGHYAFDGAMGGHLAWCGRPMSRLVGVEFIASAFDRGSYYIQGPGRADPGVAFAFKGIGPDELIGDFGLAGGGAAGQEVDWFQPGPDTPGDIIVLATSTGHSYVMDQGLDFKSVGKHAHADIVLFARPGGGAVFSVGSISWPQSLSYNRYINNVSKLTENVLKRFRDRRPLDPRP